jgi:HPt (histidine-containing phosphotransfer) domain-containing protein
MTVVTDALANLSRIFAAQLPTRLAEIVEQIEALEDVPWHTLKADGVHRQVHSLTGSAGTFGMPQVSAAARPLELVLAHLLGREEGPSLTELADIDAAWKNLLGVAEINLCTSKSGKLAPI